LGLVECARGLAGLGVYGAGFSYCGRSMLLLVLEDGAYLDSHGLPPECSDVDIVAAPRSVMRGDIEASESAELIASLLLVKPMMVVGSWEEYWRDLVDYVSRISVGLDEELRRVFGEAYHRVRVAPHMPLVYRLSRIARFYTWMRSLFSCFLSEPQVHHWLRRIGGHVLSERLGLYEADDRLPGFLRPTGREPPCCRGGGGGGGIAGLMSLVVDFSRILEGLRVRLHPLLRDPFLLLRLDRARIATRLVRFEEQLYGLTGVAPMLARLERESLVRSVKRVSWRGFTTAIVKYYRGAVAFKWMLVYLLTLHLPRPRLAARRRLNAEYEYTCRLMEEGFYTHEPLLVDPRRLMAAYKYVEGKPLDALVREGAVAVYEELGSLLAWIHGRGFALWDTNPSNFIYTGRGIYMVDLEQARRLGGVEEAAWDVALASYYLAILAPRTCTRAAAGLASGYLEAGGDPRVLEEAVKLKYMAPFIPLAPINLLERIRGSLLSAVTRT